VHYIRTVKLSGQPQRKRVRRERSRLQQQLQQLCEKYADGARDMQQFLRAVGHTIRNSVLVFGILNKTLR